MAITVPASLARPLRRARCRHAGSEPGVRTPATALNWMVRQTALCNGPCKPGLPWRCSRSRARRSGDCRSASAAQRARTPPHACEVRLRDGGCRGREDITCKHALHHELVGLESLDGQPCPGPVRIGRRPCHHPVAANALDGGDEECLRTSRLGVLLRKLRREAPIISQYSMSSAKMMPPNGVPIQEAAKVLGMLIQWVLRS